MTFCMGERKQKGFLTVTLIAVTDCHISSFTLNLLNTKILIKILTCTLDIFIFHFSLFIGLLLLYSALCLVLAC